MLGIIVGSALASAIVVTAAIYLTPLKNIDLIQPKLNEVDPAIFWADYQAHPDNYVFIDVRNASQYAVEHATDSINIPAAFLYDKRTQLPMAGKQIALMCGDGRLAAVAYGYLAFYGFTNLIHIQGGLQNWVSEGLPVEGADAATSTASSTLSQ